MSNALTVAQLAKAPVLLFELGEASGATTAINQGSAGHGFDGAIGANVVMGTVPGAIAGTFGANFNGGSTGALADIISVARDIANAHGLQPSTHLTVECAIAAKATAADVILQYGYPSENSNGAPYSLQRDPHLVFVESADGGTNTADNFDTEVGNFLVAARFNGLDGKVEIWVDGVLAAESEYPATPPLFYDDSHTAYGLMIGGGDIGGGLTHLSMFNGVIQNVAMWGRALTDAELVDDATQSGLWRGPDEQHSTGIFANLTGRVVQHRDIVNVSVGANADGSDPDTGRGTLVFPTARVFGGNFDPTKPVTISVTQ